MSSREPAAIPKTSEIQQEQKSLHQNETGDDGGSAWSISSWLTQAKDKTWSTIELVKRDLNEFSDTVQQQTSNLVQATTSAITQNAPQIESTAGGWVRDFASKVNEILTVDSTKDEADTEIPVTIKENRIVDRSQARLYAIQTDAETYLLEPEGAPELYEDWLDHFNLDDHKKEIGDLLTEVPAIRQLYTQLVPLEVSPRDFWHRYYYKIHLLELDEARRQAFFRRSFETDGNSNRHDDEDALAKEFSTAWAEEDEDSANRSDLLKTGTSHLYNISSVEEGEHEKELFSQFEAETKILAENKTDFVEKRAPDEVAKRNESEAKRKENDSEAPRKNSLSLMKELKDAAEEDRPETGKSEDSVDLPSPKEPESKEDISVVSSGNENGGENHSTSSGWTSAAEDGAVAAPAAVDDESSAAEDGAVAAPAAVDDEKSSSKTGMKHGNAGDGSEWVDWDE